MKRILIITLLSLSVVSSASAKPLSYNKITPHPRLLMTAGQEKKIAKLLEDGTNAHLCNANELIFSFAESLFDQPCVVRPAKGHILAQSREVEKRVLYLAYAYRITGDVRYAKRAEEIANYVFGQSTPIFSPTGGLKISAQDLAKVMKMHMNLGTTPEGTQIISKESAEAMQSIVAPKTDEGDAYGFAIRTSKQLLDGHTMIGHTGGAYGVYTSMFWNSERNFGFVVMTNGCNGRYDNNFMAIHRECVAAMHKYFVAE